MCKAIEEMRNEAMEEAVRLRDKEMIARKLSKNWSPEKIHEYDEYPLELILEVQSELASER